MKDYPLKDYAPESFERFVLEGAQGVVRELDATITTQAQGLKLLPRHGDEGFFSTTVFKNLNGSIVKYTVTTV